MLLRFRHLRLLPAPLGLCLVDVGLTLLGQPAAYWKADTSAINELSPEAHRLLALHPAAFVAGVIAWTAALTLLLLLLPRAIALFLAVGAAIGHTVGACAWLWLWATDGYQAAVGLCLIAAGGLVASVLWEEAATFGIAPAPCYDRWDWLRWPLVAALAAGPVYAFLWPH